MANEVSNGLHNAVAYHWEYADAAARTGATGFTSDDLGKWARQDDTNALWMLTATTPTWAPVGGGAITAAQIAYADSTGALIGNAHLTYIAGGSGGHLVSDIIGAGTTISGWADTGTGVDGEATGAGGWGVYGYSEGAGGRGVVAEAGDPAVVGLEVLAPASPTVNPLQVLINNVEQFAVAPSGRPRFVSTPPSSASDTGTAGELAWDSGFLYICVSTNTWKRVAVATW